MLLPLSGLGTTDQAVPFHDSMRVRSTKLLFRYPPTATHELAETQDTPWRKLSNEERFGLATTDQAVPFHDSTRVRSTPPLRNWPTATHEVAERQDAPWMELCFLLLLRLGTTDQAVPSQDSMR